MQQCHAEVQKRPKAHQFALADDFVKPRPASFLGRPRVRIQEEVRLGLTTLVNPEESD
jgi:hypothetical protein